MDNVTKDEMGELVEDTAEMTEEILPAKGEEDITGSVEDATHAPDGEGEEYASLSEETTAKEGEVDYERVMAEDLLALKSEFPELSHAQSITELDNPLRYAALRDLGLSPVEAYLATAKRTKRDNRSHLTTAYGKNATPPEGIMTQRELAEARNLFGSLSDTEIRRLYKRVKERS